MKDFFTCDDFDLNLVTASAEEHCTKLASKQANKKLNALIESWPVVYWAGKEQLIYRENIKDAAHKARLAFIEPIVKEPCKHAPIHVLKNMHQSQVLTAGKVGFNFFDGWVCKHCGIAIVAEWRTK